MESSINDWFTEFYKTSDNGAAHQEYTTFFTPDARLIMGDKQATGTQEILAVRQAMWEKVSSRKHSFDIFSSEKKPNEYMLSGTVEYGLKSGGSSTVDWVAKAELSKKEGRLAMSFYQVYLSNASK